jgi:hypothetical protein
MTERQLTFIDGDENLLLVRLKRDRVQLCVVDSRPELEGDELRAFATALFATYIGGPLAVRLEAAREHVGEVRDHLAASGGAPELLAALDRSLGAIEAAARAMTAPAAPEGRDAPGAAPLPGRRRKPARGTRAREGGFVGGSGPPSDEAPAGSAGAS